MLHAIGLADQSVDTSIFFQSDVPAHSELMWILSCQASTGYLSRMTQWKDKTANQRENDERLKLGLFSYPVLQAADILAHGATHVPVGEDQAQHLEFTRELAQGFNHVYGKEGGGHGSEILKPPETLISPAPRVMSLTDPRAKMSKSDANPKSRIMLTDDEKEIREKIKTAVTDSDTSRITYDPERRPGVGNLIEVLYHLSTSDGALKYESRDDVTKDLEGLSFRAFKDKVAETVEATVKPIRERYEHCKEEQMDEVWKRAQEDALRAQHNADKTMSLVRQAMGLDKEQQPSS